MKLSEKVKFLRQSHGWTQEQIAEKLGMSINGYGCIERGETDANLSRLEQISEVFGISLAELFDLENTKRVVKFANFSSDCNNDKLTYQVGTNQETELKHELEKAQLIIKQQQEKINYLEEIVTLLKQK